MSVTLVAPAKVNLYLAVGDERPDGFHGLDTVFMALDLGDEVAVRPAERLSLVCEPAVDVPDEANLAWRAAVAMGEAFGRPSGFALHVTKRVPAGSGLGGGSADAAAVIAALASMWGAAADDPRLMAVASSLGADAAFPLLGGCALYTDRGERLVRRLPVPDIHLAIARGPRGVSTADAYAMFDRLGHDVPPGTGALEAALASGDARSIGAALHNNMTSAALALVPEIGDALAFIRAQDGCTGTALCGSGAAVFGVFTDRAEAEMAVGRARERGLWAATARPRRGGTLDQTTGVNQ